MGKTKVIEFITTLSTGGAEQLVKEYSTLLDKKNFDVMVLVIWRKENSQNEKALLSAGVKIVYISDYLPKGNDRITRVFRKIKRKQFVYNFLKQERPDIIHAHLAVTEYLASLPLKKWNVKVLYTCHNVLSDTFDTKATINYAKKLIKNADMKMIALHTDMAEEINELLSIQNCMVLNNGIDFNEFSANKNVRERTRKMLEIDDDTFVIGHVGRFTKQKNQMFLVKLFEKILDKKKAHLLLIGAGKDVDFVKAYIAEHGFEEHVTILSNRSDIAELMNAMDVFVFPSVFEGFGIVLVEAQAVGLRCVVSQAISKYACLSPLVNVLDLSDSEEKWISHILGDEWELTQFKGIEEFDIYNVVHELEKIYEDMVSGTSSL